MTISHPTPDHLEQSKPMIFAELMDISCSVCAPDTMTEIDVLKFAADEKPLHGAHWKSVDKSKLGMGSPTPNPCNQAPGRTHWLLFSTRFDRFR